jgi:hypothetical protein
MARIEISNRIEGSVDLEEGQTLVAEVTVTAAEMRALNATPHELVAAPGAGKALRPVWFSVEMLGVVAFAGIAGGEDLHLRTTDNAGSSWGMIETTGFLDQDDEQSSMVYVNARSLADNSNLVLGNSGAITLGSDCLVKVGYNVVEAE